MYQKMIIKHFFQASFDWLPRRDIWEHVCFVKMEEEGLELPQLKFFVNGEEKGKGERVFKALYK